MAKVVHVVLFYVAMWSVGHGGQAKRECHCNDETSGTTSISFGVAGFVVSYEVVGWTSIYVAVPLFLISRRWWRLLLAVEEKRREYVLPPPPDTSEKKIQTMYTHTSLRPTTNTGGRFEKLPEYGQD